MITKFDDHSEFDFKSLAPKRNATAFAPLPATAMNAPFDRIIGYVRDRIMPPIQARGGFNFEVSVEYRAHARFKRGVPGFGYYLKLHLSMLMIPDDRPLMMRRGEGIKNEKVHEQDIATAVKKVLH